MGETRKLAAILVSDVVGYSRLTGADEDRILARLRTLRSDLIDPIISVHHGRIVKRTGDGAIVEFRSVVDAVNCAIEIQRAMVERNAEVTPDKRIEFRIGIHLGDVVEESDGDLMGDGVNIAARLEGVAKPGAICLSEDAYRHVKGRLDLKVSDLGLTQLKNIAEPVRAYSLQVGVPAPKKRSALAALSVGIAALLVVMAAGAWYMFGANRPATEAPNATALAASLSIVVLPFANLSGDASQDYVADAIGEELTTALSRLKNSFVIARTTALTYKGKSVDVKQIGKELGVRYVLEGSAQRVGDRMRVSAQLIDAETGAHLWADQFDQPRADLLEMQDEIVTRLGRALDLQLTEADVARTQRLRPGNLDAEDLALRCRSEWQQFFYDAAKVEAAFGLCDQALKLDERNVTALGLLALKWILPVTLLKSADPDFDIRQADDFVSRALAVDPDDPMAHLVRAWIFNSQGKFEAQQVEAERIISTNPSNILAYIAECNAYNDLGRAEEAIECSDKALRLSPRDPFASAFLLQKGFAQLQLDRYDQSIVSIRRALAQANDPILTDQLAYNIVAQVAAGQSLDRDAAIREADTLASQSLAANQNDFFARFVKSLVLIQQNHLLEAITEMERIPPGIRLIYFVYHAACDANAHLGRADQTIECADKLIALAPQYQNLHQAHFDKGWALLLQGKDEGGIESLRRSISIRPSASMTRAFLAAALGATGHEAEARDETAHYLSMPGVRLKTLALWQDYWNHWPSDNPAVLDFRKRFFDGLRKAGMPEE